MLADHLPLRELQKALPDQLLTDMAVLIRRLSPTSSILDPMSDRSFLASLYESQRGPDFLARRAERLRLLDHVPEPVLRELAAKLSLRIDSSFDNIVNQLADINWGDNEQTRIFLNHFGYSHAFFPEPSHPQPEVEWIAPPNPPLQPLRDYQSSVFHRAYDALQPPCSRVMIQMPTGSGKTRTAMEVVSSFLNEERFRTVIWLAHSEELCAQAVESFSHIWRHLGKYEIQLCRCWGTHQPNLPITAPGIIVAGFHKLNSLKKRGMRSPQADLVVVDEAHMVLAPTFDEVVSWCKTHSARIVGLSATPGRGSGGDAQSRRLASYFNECIINIDTGPYGVIETLQDRGILAQIMREPLLTNIRFSLSHDDWQRLEEQFDYPESFLRQIAQDHERNRVISEKLLELSKTSRRTIVFATSVEQSKLLAAILVYHGISVAHIDSSTPSHARRHAVSKFKHGEINFLINYQVFSTGLDVPGIDTVVIARPTKSIVLYSQMVGRGLRGPAVGGTTTVRLIDVIDNIIDYSGGLDFVYDYFTGYWT